MVLKRVILYLFCSLFLFGSIDFVQAQYRMGEEKPRKIKKEKKKFKKKKKIEKKPVRKKKKKKSAKKKSFKPWPGTEKKDKSAIIESKTSESAPPVLDEDPYLSNLSRHFEIQKDKLKYLRDIKHGYREIIKGLIVARDAQVEVGRVLNMRIQNQSWDKISERFFINRKDLITESDQLLKPIKKMLPSKRIEERPTTRK